MCCAFLSSWYRLTYYVFGWLSTDYLPSSYSWVRRWEDSFNFLTSSFWVNSFGFPLLQVQQMITLGQFCQFFQWHHWYFTPIQFQPLMKEVWKIHTRGHDGLIKTWPWKRAHWWKLNGFRWWSEQNKQQAMVNELCVLMKLSGDVIIRIRNS